MRVFRRRFRPAVYIGAFFEAGGKAVYYFHYAPKPLSLSCGGTSPGTFSMFTITPDFQIKQPDSQFFAGQMITLEWVQPGSGEASGLLCCQRYS
jgi:hypothetical protein